MAELVPRRTPAAVRARRILAEPNAQVIGFVLVALVHVVAGSVVAGQLVARLATAPVRAPVVYAPLVAQPRNLAALVHVRADQILRAGLPEAVLAVAPVRADRVDALRVLRAHLALVQVALVHVLAPVVPADYVPRRTQTHVAAALVLAHLVRAALGLPG